MFAGDANPTTAESLAETGMLDKPCGRDFMLRFEGWVTGDFKSFCSGLLGKSLVLFVGKNWILEERSGAAAILVSRGDQHPFAGTDSAHCLANIRQLGFGLPAGKMLFEIGI